jgi:hypothetical protein
MSEWPTIRSRRVGSRNGYTNLPLSSRPDVLALFELQKES